MIIGFDGNEANIGKRVGVNVYVYDLLCAISRALSRRENEHRLIVYLSKPPLTDMPDETKFLKYKVIRGRKLWVLTRLMPELFLGKIKPDVIFSPSHYLPPLAPMPKVCSIMDLGYLKFSGQFKKSTFWQLKYWSAISMMASKHIIVISQATADDIVRHYPFARRKITVAHLGYDQKKFNTGISPNDVRRIRKKYAIVDDYILFLSTLKPSKNIEGLLDACASIFNFQFTIYKKYKLVIAGRKGWMFEPIFKKVKELGLENKVVFTDFISEKDKPALLAGAKVFVAPSFWEGFGLHVVEAMACGTPVVVSNVASLPEIVGRAGVLVNPNDASSIAEGIKKVLNLSEKRYNQTKRDCAEQASKFSWEKTAGQVLGVLLKVGEKKNV